MQSPRTGRIRWGIPRDCICSSTPAGSKLWRLKYRIRGVERKLALGAYPEVSLADARTNRDAARKHLAKDVDPNAVKRQARIDATVRAGNSFASIAGELIEKKKREGLAEATLDCEIA
jgi:Arm DNA-binding domain